MSRKFVGKKMLVFAQAGVGGAERMSVTITKSLDRDKFKVQYYLVGDFEDERAPLKPVSYTHLTLPTNSLV